MSLCVVGCLLMPFEVTCFCALFVVRCLLLAVRCDRSLCVVCCFVVCCFVVCASLFVECCALLVVGCLVNVACWFMFLVCCVFDC